ncbi:MAG TPA: hypothetical protein VD968_02125 [Pyrinomonadaceae bacterium]|nr:hypothetical protein [Pyrinomonadaceae bacterium]
MLRNLTAALLAAACCLLAAGCGGKEQAPGVEQLLGRLNPFTEELVRKVESAQNPSEGVSEAQKHLGAGKAALAEEIARLKRSPEFQRDAEARRKLLEAEVEGTTRVSGLRTKYMDAAMSDPAFKAKLDRLVSDYQELFKD